MALHTIVLIAAGFAQPHPNLEVGVTTSYVRGGSFDGPGIAAQSLWSPNEYFALGPMVDMTYVSAGSFTDRATRPASYNFTSTLAGGMVQARLPLRLVEPFAALGFGYVAVSEQKPRNALCTPSSGFDAMLAAGARAAVSEHLMLGLRGSARPVSAGITCLVASTSGTLDLPVIVFAIGSTLDYRW